MVSESERRVEILKKVGDRIKNELEAKPYIFVVGSVREGTARKDSDIDCMIYAFTDKGRGRTSSNIRHIFREELREGGIPLPTFTPVVVTDDYKRLAHEFLMFARKKEFYRFWPFFKGKCAYGKGPDKLIGQVGREMRREIGMANFKGIQKKLFEIDDFAFKKSMSKRL